MSVPELPVAGPVPLPPPLPPPPLPPPLGVTGGPVGVVVLVDEVGYGSSDSPSCEAASAPSPKAAIPNIAMSTAAPILSSFAISQPSTVVGSENPVQTYRETLVSLCGAYHTPCSVCVKPVSHHFKCCKHLVPNPNQLGVHSRARTSRPPTRRQPSPQHQRKPAAPARSRPPTSPPATAPTPPPRFRRERAA